ncbi:MAG: hypothetical protein F6J89_21375 [Symploca sp. SIO1C4]|uniref:Leucine-rich repeat domain-containing protein n=1 Tax=Symploca sp. SIO1C4 TaxID=2607765 RepID=A0A6B3NEQ7_9CYAN|nr:hypothetical protein [Symploca sp. SIO1C4]
MSQLRQLKGLDLSENQVDDINPLSNLTNLAFLKINITESVNIPRRFLVQQQGKHNYQRVQKLSVIKTKPVEMVQQLSAIS